MDETTKRGRPLKGNARRVRLAAWVAPDVLRDAETEKVGKESNGDVIERWRDGCHKRDERLARRRANRKTEGASND
jgi:molybdopterin converting factor small subunit